VNPWPEPVERVSAFLREAGAEARIEEFSQGTPTAQDAANAVGCRLAQIVKSLVFDCDGRSIVALVPGDRRADPRKLAKAAGCERARVAGPDRVREATGFEPGAVAPFPLPRVERVLIDPSLLRYERLARGGKDLTGRTSPSPVRLKLLDEPDFTHIGRMDFLDNTIERATGTIRGRAHFANADGLFTPGMFARVQLPGSASYEALLVPDVAIGTEQARKFVLVVNADNVVTQKYVTLGELDKLRSTFGKYMTQAVMEHLLAGKVQLGGELAGLLSVGVLIESVFSWPGIGLYTAQSISSDDYSAIMGTSLLLTVTFVLVNLGVDLLYAVIDPRIRY